MANPAIAQPTDRERLLRAAALRKHLDWPAIAALGDGLEPTTDPLRLEVLDAVAFAFCQLHQRSKALDLNERLHALAPTPRRAGAVAYVCYDTLWAKDKLPGRDPLALRKLFLARIAEQIAGETSPIKALYRRATFFALLESAQDRKALNDYEAAIALYERLDPEARQRQHYSFKPYIKSLYGAARSALELKLADHARQRIARCLRVDQASDHVEPVFKLYLAARVCAFQGEHERAERGFRLALDARGPRDRAFVHHELGRSMVARADHQRALDWIDQHVPAVRRPPFVWVSVGDWLKASGRLDQAMSAWESALFRDRDMRHLTLCRLGEAHVERGELKKARQRFEEALRLRKKRDQAIDPRAQRGLAELENLEAARKPAPAAPVKSEQPATAAAQGRKAS